MLRLYPVHFLQQIPDVFIPRKMPDIRTSLISLCYAIQGTTQTNIVALSLLIIFFPSVTVYSQTGYPLTTGCASPQAVSHQLQIAVVWVRSQAISCWICGGQSSTGAAFL
jgi:hypothetical protein